MHRIDICRATGLRLEATAEHEGHIVDGRGPRVGRPPRRPYLLELTGPAGGRWEKEGSGEQINMDALEFCRAVGGRATYDGLLSVQVPF